MSQLLLTITKAGMDKFTAAQLGEDIDLSVSSVGLTDAEFVAAPTLTALPGVFRKVATISGNQVGDNIVHMTIRDDAEISYSVRGFGLYLADGTLFAVYGQSERIFTKATPATFYVALDIAFPAGDVSELRFGDTNFLNPPATTETKGVVELATEAEALAGLDAFRVAPVAVLAKLLAGLETRLKAAIDALGGAAGQALDGLAARTVYGSGLVKGGGRNDENRTLTVDAATSAEVKAGAIADKAITPAALRGAYTTVLAEEGRRVHPDGFVEMWGRATHPNIEAEFTLAFATPFPNACFGVLPMTINTNKSVDGQTTIQEIALYADRAVLFVQNHQTNANEAGGFRWRAWGY